MISISFLHRYVRACVIPFMFFGFLLETQAQTTTIHSSLQYKEVRHVFDSATTDRTGQPITRSITWSYPIFISSNTPSINGLNKWIRSVSLRNLVDDEDDIYPKLSEMSDFQVLAYLKEHFYDADQSEVSVGYSLGDYISFTRYVEVIGSGVSHGIEHLLYDVSRDKEAPIKSLFKAGALAEIVDLFFEEASKEFPSCSPSRLNIGWYSMDIHGPSSIGIWIPYSPSIWDECGEAQTLSGKKIRRLLKSPKKLQPVRSIRRIN